MKQLFISIIATFALAVGVGVLAPAPAGAINVFEECRGGNADTAVCKAKNDDKANTLTRDIINILLWALGVISVIMIIIGGIRYATSDGDSSKLKSAKDTVLYSVVGLVVALLAYSIVNFVVGRF